jgi:hypothetical protein
MPDRAILRYVFWRVAVALALAIVISNIREGVRCSATSLGFSDSVSGQHRNYQLRELGSSGLLRSK